MKAIHQHFVKLAMCASALTLVACGGDSPSSLLSLRGVAATGLAIDGGSVTVQCVSGSGDATTLADGSYRVTVYNGEGPCLVTVTKGDVVLRSMAPKTTSGSAVANVTPFSNAIVNALVTAKGAGSFEGLINGGTNAPTNSELTAAVFAVVAQINLALDNLGLPTLDPNIDLLAKPDYVAATESQPNIGDALDKALDALVTGADLPEDLVTAINEATDNEVDPNPTGATGGN